MRKIVACAAALAGFALPAHAADLGDGASMKDPLPDTLTYHGVTIYGTIDVGYAYQTNGRPLGSIVSDLEYSPFTTTRNYTGQSISTLQANALEQSKIGIKIEEDIGLGFAAIGKLDTAFDPMSGQITDGCSSFVQNTAKPYTAQTSNADSGRCGQAFNGVAYAGVSSSLYGTLTVGRQNTLQLDAIGQYDPMSLSYALSLLGYSGTNGGSGSTEAARWDNALKYLYTYGPLHAGVMYSNGGDDTGMYGYGISGSLGAVWKGFSIDGVYTKENGVVNLLGANKDTVVGAPLAAAISNDEGWSVMGKYTYDFGGGFKDQGPAATLTLFAGYTNLDVSNSPDAVSFSAGGYAISDDNNYFTTTKNLQFEWAGAKYALRSGWSFTGAFYHVDQNAFVSDNKVCTAGGASRTDCAGTYNQGSFLVDYAFTKHFDVYAGVTYAIVDGGMAAGFPGTPCGTGTSGACYATQTNGSKTSIDTAAVVTGLRIKF